MCKQAQTHVKWPLVNEQSAAHASAVADSCSTRGSRLSGNARLTEHCCETSPASAPQPPLLPLVLLRSAGWHTAEGASCRSSKLIAAES